jgi:hypothetical protein
VYVSVFDFWMLPILIQVHAKPYYSNLIYYLFSFEWLLGPGLMLPEFYHRLYEYNYCIFSVHGISASVHGGNVITEFSGDTSI